MRVSYYLQVFASRGSFVKAGHVESFGDSRLRASAQKHHRKLEVMFATVEYEEKVSNSQAPTKYRDGEGAGLD